MCGCGSPPILVSTVVVNWSLIKFFCVLSGILAAQSILTLYGQPYLLPRDAPNKKAARGLRLNLAGSGLSLAVEGSALDQHQASVARASMTHNDPNAIRPHRHLGCARMRRASFKQ